MQSLRYFSLLSFFAFFNFSSLAQLKLVVGESYLQGMSIKKVFVSVEDHTVWALTFDGKVYIKKINDTDFQLYAPTAQINVEEITGYNEDEMYFLVKPDLIVHFKLGIKIEIKVPYPEVTHINNISIINENNTTPYYQNNPSVPNKDYLAVATNKHMYILFRGDIAVTETYLYDNSPIVDQPDWRITNTGNFSADFQYTYPPYSCYIQPDHTTISFFSQIYYTFRSAIPDNGAYPSKINTTLSSVYRMSIHSDYFSLLNFWGTDEGLFMKTWQNCPSPKIFKLIDNVAINDLEEIHSLSSIAMQNYILAATDKGIYYTPASIFTDLNVTDAENFKLLHLPTFPEEKVNSICMDANEDVSIDYSSGSTHATMCEKVAWVASTSGIKKVYCLLEQEYFDSYIFSNFIPSISQSNEGDYTKSIFQTCGNQNVTIKILIPDEFDSQLLIQWYKDGIELPLLIGKKTVTLTEGGNYHYVATVLCEGIRLTSIPIIINHDKGPEITFAYPPTINICANQSFTFQTTQLTGYIYRWFKDDVQIQHATESSYTANSTGNYRVEVSSCSASFESSSTVTLNVLPIVTPILTKDKNNYCLNETAILKVENPQQLQTKWYLDDVELIDLDGQSEAHIIIPGTYHVSFANAANCEMNSAPLVVNFLTKPTVSITRGSDRILCYGETVRLTANSDHTVSYLWSTGETTSTIEVGSAGKYNLTISRNGICSVTSEEVEVFVNMELQFIKPLLVPEKTAYCISEIATLSVNNPMGFKTKWFLNGSELTIFTNQNRIDVNTPGSYTVDFINQNMCSVRSVPYQLIFNQPQDAKITRSNYRTLCDGETVQLSVPFVPGNSYLWSNGETTNTITVNTNGIYKVEIKTAADCYSMSTSEDVVVNRLPILQTPPTEKICTIEGEQLELMAPKGYLYYVWNGNKTTNSSFVVTKPGIYNLSIEDENGCKASTTYNVLPYCKEISAPTAFSPNGDGINDIWRVSGLENDPTATVSIYNRFGNKIYEARNNNAAWNGSSNNGPATVGVYYYVIISKNSDHPIKGTITLIR